MTDVYIEKLKIFHDCFINSCLKTLSREKSLLLGNNDEPTRTSNKNIELIAALPIVGGLVTFFHLFQQYLYDAGPNHNLKPLTNLSTIEQAKLFSEIIRKVAIKFEFFLEQADDSAIIQGYAEAAKDILFKSFNNRAIKINITNLADVIISGLNNIFPLNNEPSQQSSTNEKSNYFLVTNEILKELLKTNANEDLNNYFRHRYDLNHQTQIVLADDITKENSLKFNLSYENLNGHSFDTDITILQLENLKKNIDRLSIPRKNLNYQITSLNDFASKLKNINLAQTKLPQSIEINSCNNDRLIQEHYIQPRLTIIDNNQQESISLNQLFNPLANNDKEMNKILIFGETGSGKTSLLQNILYLESRGALFYNKFYFVWKVDARFIYNNWKDYYDADHLSENLVKCFLDYNLRQVEGNNLFSLSKREVFSYFDLEYRDQTLLLIDNFDLMIELYRNSEEIRSLFSYFDKFKNIIAFSKKINLDNIEHSYDRIVRINRFDSLEAIDFVEKYLTLYSTKVENNDNLVKAESSLKVFLNKNKQIQEFLLPIHLVMMCENSLFETAKIQKLDPAYLYHNFILTIGKRHILNKQRALNHLDRRLNPEDIDFSDVAALPILNTLKKIAYDTYYSRQNFFGINIINKNCRDYIANFNDLINLGFLRVNNFIENEQLKNVYMFINEDIRGFLAAEYLIERINNDDIASFIIGALYEPQFLSVLKYMIYLLKMKDDDDITKSFIKMIKTNIDNSVFGGESKIALLLHLLKQAEISELEVSELKEFLNQIISDKESDIIFKMAEIIKNANYLADSVATLLSNRLTSYSYQYSQNEDYYEEIKISNKSMSSNDLKILLDLLYNFIDDINFETKVISYSELFSKVITYIKDQDRGWQVKKISTQIMTKMLSADLLNEEDTSRLVEVIPCIVDSSNHLPLKNTAVTFFKTIINLYGSDNEGNFITNSLIEYANSSKQVIKFIELFSKSINQEDSHLYHSTIVAVLVSILKKLNYFDYITANKILISLPLKSLDSGSLLELISTKLFQEIDNKDDNNYRILQTIKFIIDANPILLERYENIFKDTLDSYKRDHAKEKFPLSLIEVENIKALFTTCGSKTKSSNLEELLTIMLSFGAETQIKTSLRTIQVASIKDYLNPLINKAVLMENKAVMYNFLNKLVNFLAEPDYSVNRCNTFNVKPNAVKSSVTKKEPFSQPMEDSHSTKKIISETSEIDKLKHVLNISKNSRINIIDILVYVISETYLRNNRIRISIVDNLIDIYSNNQNNEIMEILVHLIEFMSPSEIVNSRIFGAAQKFPLTYSALVSKFEKIQIESENLSNQDWIENIKTYLKIIGFEMFDPEENELSLRNSVKRILDNYIIQADINRIEILDFYFIEIINLSTYGKSFMKLVMELILSNSNLNDKIATQFIIKCIKILDISIKFIRKGNSIVTSFNNKEFLFKDNPFIQVILDTNSHNILEIVTNKKKRYGSDYSDNQADEDEESLKKGKYESDESDTNIDKRPTQNPILLNNQELLSLVRERLIESSSEFNSEFSKLIQDALEYLYILPISREEKEELEIESLGIINNFVGETFLKEVGGFYQYISIALSRSSLSKQAVKVINYMKNIIYDVDALIDSDEFYLGEDSADHISILLTQLENIIEFVGSGIVFLGKPPRGPSFDPDEPSGGNGAPSYNHDSPQDAGIIILGSSNSSIYEDFNYDSLS